MNRGWKALLITLVLSQPGCPVWVGGKIVDKLSTSGHRHCGDTVVPCKGNPNQACCAVCGGRCR